jgi:hypothetical protein
MKNEEKKSFREFSTQTEMNFEWKKRQQLLVGLGVSRENIWFGKIVEKQPNNVNFSCCYLFYEWCSCVPATWPPPPHKTNEPRPISGGTYSIEVVLT